MRAAAQAGAECVILCDTNGGSLPDEIADIVSTVQKDTDVSLGIHTHNDIDMAVAGALAGVMAGATQVQGTISRYFPDGIQCLQNTPFEIARTV